MDIKKLWVYFVLSIIAHIFILSIPLRTGYILSKPSSIHGRKKKKPTIVRLIEIPHEKPEKKRVKSPKNPKYVSRYTHRTNKESIPKVVHIPGSPWPKSPTNGKGKEMTGEKEKPKVRSSRNVLAEKTKKGNYRLPPLEKLLPNPEDMAKLQNRPPSRGPQPRESTLDLGEIEREEKKILSLNTMEFKYLSYFLSIKRKIYLLWDYPKEAIMAGMEGRLKIRFTIGKDGNLEELKLVKSSGYRILDEEALTAIRDAAPFNPIPKRLGQDHITILATFEYILVK